MNLPSVLEDHDWTLTEVPADFRVQMHTLVRGYVRKETVKRHMWNDLVSIIFTYILICALDLILYLIFNKLFQF